MDTTGTPEDGHPAGQSDEPGQSGEHGVSTPAASSTSHATASASLAAPDAEVPGDEYSNGGGFGYGPGYGEPGDSGYGYGYGAVTAVSGELVAGEAGSGAYAQGEFAPGDLVPGEPAPTGALTSGPTSGSHLWGASLGGHDPGGETLPPVVGPTPALRGLPGGPGIEPVAEDTGTGGRGDRLLQSHTSSWQKAHNVWTEAGVVWQRPVADWEPAEAEWDRIRAAWTPPGRRRAFRAGGASSPGPIPRGGGASGASPRLGGATAVTHERTTRHEPGAGSGGRSPGQHQASGPAAGLSQGSGRGGRSGVGRRALFTGAAVVTAVAVLVVAGVVVTAGRTPSQKPRHAAARSAYPPARAAGADFTTTPSLASRGVFQSLRAVASYGATVVAGGSETGTGIGRTQFFVSTDGGRTWQLAPVTAPGGVQPPTGLAPTRMVAGPAGWLALGPGVSWTSKTGRSWQLTEAAGITPANPGDRVLTVTATASGFLAGGAAKGAPVIWTSSNGSTWQRMDAGALQLKGPGAVHQIVFAAAHGDNTVIAAKVTRTVHTGAAGQRRTRHVTEMDVWRSADGGRTWILAPVPVNNGAANQISGLASSGAGFVVVRPGNGKATGPDGVVYVSTTGRAWSYAAKISDGKKAGLRLVAVHGSDQGAVVAAAVNGGNLLAFRSGDGRSWARTPVLASANVTSLLGLTVATGGNVMAVGATARQQDSRQGFLAVAGAGPRAARTLVGLAGIRGATYPQRAVSSLAASPGLDVAVGSANGEPAIWVAPPGGIWAHAAGVSRGVFGRQGQASLTGVTYGPGGWLAVGGHTAGPSHPLVLFSRDGKTWQAADGIPPFASAGVSANGAAYGSAGYVIVGQRRVGGRTIAAAWHAPSLIPAKTGTKSTKNTNKKTSPLWTPAGDAGKGDLDGKDGPRSMLAVTGGPFGYVAVGQHGGRPAVWTSPDGRRWRLHDLPAPGGGASAALRYVTSSGNRIVAMGTVEAVGRPAPLVAVSVDGGKSWQEPALALPGGAGAVTGLTAAAGGFIAVGTIGPPGGSNVVVMTSPDGSQWKAVVPFGEGLSGPGVQEITALTTAQGQLLGAGFTATQTTEDATLWIAPPAPRDSR
ncbi:MAG: hypothetical protein ACM3ML_37335 [Micromonosporaceae bacterium]